MKTFSKAPLRVLMIASCTALSLRGAVNASPPSATVVPTIAWSVPIEVAHGPAVKGPWRQNDSDYRYVDDPAVALDADGNATVVWVDQTKKDVLLQRLDETGKPQFGQPVNVSRSAAVFSWLPRVAFPPEKPQEIFVLWQEIVFSGGSHGGETFFARSEDGGKTFAEPLNLSKSIGGDGKGRINEQVWHNGSHDLLLDAQGRLSAAWTEYDGQLWFCHSEDGGRSFSEATKLAGDKSAPARAPSLAAAENGKIYVVWTRGEDEGADVRIATSNDNGATFSAEGIVSTTPGYSDAPKVAVDAHGTVHVVFAESAGGPFTPAQIRYARMPATAAAFEASREISRPDPDGAVAASYPSLAIDGIGLLYVTWELFPADSDAPRGLGYALSADGGETFSPPAVVPGSAEPHTINGSLEGRLMRKLAVNGAGSVAVVNSNFEADKRSRVWLLRGKTP